jgi:TIR domain
MSRDVFISYSQPDYHCAMEMVARIEEQGIDCWIAPRDIAPSADWAAEIIEAISSARTMILVFSASSNDSPQVRREVERAVHKQVSILPFRIEDVLPSKSLEYFLSAQHWLDAFTPPREPHYARLCAYLKRLLDMPAAPMSTPAGAHAEPPGGAQQSSAHSGTHPVLFHMGGVSFDPALILHVERQLAGYIGPLAKHLVRHAASHAAGFDELVDRLAAELDAEFDRKQFIQRCRSGR